MDYQYRIVYRNPNDKKEQYSFTSCFWFGTLESAIKNFEKEGHKREWITDAYRLIRNVVEPIKQFSD